jgi:hypothetical protein
MFFVVVGGLLGALSVLPPVLLEFDSLQKLAGTVTTVGHTLPSRGGGGHLKISLRQGPETRVLYASACSSDLERNTLYSGDQVDVWVESSWHLFAPGPRIWQMYRAGSALCSFDPIVARLRAQNRILLLVGMLCEVVGWAMTFSWWLGRRTWLRNVDALRRIGRERGLF